MNLFRPCFEREAFDVVLCNGVLHHTGDPHGGFKSLVPLVRPGGFLVIGLYNRFGRLMTDARRLLFRATGGRLRWIDPYLRSRSLSADKKRAWMADQYFHPHESKHTIGEVLEWFDGEALEFVRGIPSVMPGRDALDTGDLFEPVERGGRLDHAISQLQLAASSGWEGGLFLMIARKPR
jgi:SAM-dependent methyltransferase